jgi:hypothetical protein
LLLRRKHNRPQNPGGKTRNSSRPHRGLKQPNRNGHRPAKASPQHHLKATVATAPFPSPFDTSPPDMPQFALLEDSNRRLSPRRRLPHWSSPSPHSLCLPSHRSAVCRLRHLCRLVPRTRHLRLSSCRLSQSHPRLRHRHRPRPFANPRTILLQVRERPVFRTRSNSQAARSLRLPSLCMFRRLELPPKPPPEAPSQPASPAPPRPPSSSSAKSPPPLSNPQDPVTDRKPRANHSTLQDFGMSKNKVTRKTKVVCKPRKSNAAVSMPQVSDTCNSNVPNPPLAHSPQNPVATRNATVSKLNAAQLPPQLSTRQHRHRRRWGVTQDAWPNPTPSCFSCSHLMYFTVTITQYIYFYYRL